MMSLDTKCLTVPACVAGLLWGGSSELGVWLGLLDSDSGIFWTKAENTSKGVLELSDRTTCGFMA